MGIFTAHRHSCYRSIGPWHTREDGSLAQDFLLRGRRRQKAPSFSDAALYGCSADWCQPRPTADHYAVLPHDRNLEGIESAFPPKEVTKVALRLKYQMEQVVPCELEEWKITKANSPIITRKVVKAAKGAGGDEYSSCIIYCLLVCNKWFKRQALIELWDADLHEARAVACEILAKRLWVFTPAQRK